MPLKQNNDQKIETPVTRNGEPLNLAAVTLAEYKLYDERKKNLLITKTLAAGEITKSGHTFTIKLTESDTENLTGRHYHELNMVDPEFGYSTVFSERISFDATYNERVI